MYGTLTTKEQKQNKTKTNNPNKNRLRTWIDHFSKEETPGNKYINRNRNHNELPPVKMAIIKKKKGKYWQDEEKLEALHTVGGNAKWCSCCGGHYGCSSKT